MREIAANYQCHNIGTPVNRGVRAANGSPPLMTDAGLLANPVLEDERIDVLVAVLKTQTDARYEHLLEE